MYVLPTRYYAGIGSRKTPLAVLQTMGQCAVRLARCDLVLRSGGADGADTAFMLGAVPLMAVYTRHHVRPDWLTHAAKYHPAWEKCNEYARYQHARNSAIMLGPYLNNPVQFVACWTPGGKIVGGTGQALRIAKAYRIKVYNLFFAQDTVQFIAHIQTLESYYADR